MHTREYVRQALVEILETDMGESFGNIAESAKLREELGLDSVDVVSIVSQVERKFRIRLTHQELEKLITVGNVLDLLESKLSAPPPVANPPPVADPPPSAAA